MKYLKIVNFIEPNGDADYKGLDIQQFVAGSQFYDFDNKVCIIITATDDIPNHEEIITLDESQYNDIKTAIEASSASTQEKSELEQLKEQVAAQQAAINILLGV